MGRANLEEPSLSNAFTGFGETALPPLTKRAIINDAAIYITKAATSMKKMFRTISGNCIILKN